MSKKQALVSIIVPVYNAQDYLSYCIESLINQSYRNLEIILVDDGSTDDSVQICDTYAAQDSRIHVIHQQNGGISRAQNAGLDHAMGTYIAFADNDDILDAHNIEYLVHALESTGADMSKGRWQQFGVSELDTIAQQALQGVAEPVSSTVFSKPLRAYQTVFCKSLRMLGDAFGRHSEARYFNEANWCRLYRRELWDGIRFPEGMYAQDVMIAGDLYLRMNKVADVDCVLYYWLQSEGSVTHHQRSTSFYHDNFVAGAYNFNLCLDHGIRPSRSYYTVVGAIHDQSRASDIDSPEAQTMHAADKHALSELLARLPLITRLQCLFYQLIRLAEKFVYDNKVKNMK